MTTRENGLIKFIKTEKGIEKISVFLRLNGSVWYHFADGRKGGVIPENKTFFEDEL